MSKDLKINANCNHQIKEDQLYLKDDRKTIVIPKPLSSKNIELRVNGYLIKKDNPKFGYSLELDQTQAITGIYKIVFHNFRKSDSDFYQVSYSVPAVSCPKCKGLRVLADHTYSKLGKVVTVENEDKLLQEVKKGLTTELGSNLFHEWVGTRIYQLIGTKTSNFATIKSRIVQEISVYIDKYLDIQLQQANYQYISDRETFGKVLGIDVTPEVDIDISYWTIAVLFRNRTGDNLIYEKKVEIPGGANILYG